MHGYERSRKALLHEGDVGCSKLDRDGDGVGCE
ncbi:excalibur calcium-binding domain-containing protein [Paenibacillus sp. FA6]